MAQPGRLKRTPSTWTPSHRPLNSSEHLLVRVLEEMGFVVVPHASNGRWELDAYIPEPYNMGVEVDGRQFHTRPEDAARDRAREKDLQADGILVVRVWSEDLRTPEGRAKARKHIATRLLTGRGIRKSSKRKRKLL